MNIAVTLHWNNAIIREYEKEQKESFRIIKSLIGIKKKKKTTQEENFCFFSFGVSQLYNNNIVLSQKKYIYILYIYIDSLDVAS